MKMTDDFKKAYLALVRVGIPPHAAAEAQGLSRWTLFEWLTRGGHPRHSNSQQWVPPDDAVEPFKTFVEQTIQAEANAHSLPAQAAFKKARRDPDFALKWLRARHPEDWNPNRIKAVEVVAARDGQTLTVTFEDFLRIQEMKEKEGRVDG